MRPKYFSPKSYLQLLAVLLAVLSLPKSSTESLRGTVVAVFAPSWSLLSSARQSLRNFSEETIQGSDNETVYVNEAIQSLQLENQLLKNKISALEDLLRQETHLLEKNIPTVQEELHDIPVIRESEKKMMINLKAESIPAQVIFRSSAAWNSILWVNVGNINNEEIGYPLICKNSPVVVGTKVVGVIDYVGKKQSRVRLITDPVLNPSVRAIRLFNDQTWYLAKGELRGCSQARFRKKSDHLLGTGFNYDFPDHEGPARDLRTGSVLGNLHKTLPTLPIIQENDLLITTGMDGVFPPGLSVAIVSQVKMLKEGDYFYEIEASPCCGNIDQLSLVSILPSQGFDPNDQPLY